MRLRKKKEPEDHFYSGVTGKPLDETSQKIENRIWTRMREITGLTNEQIEALPEDEFDELYEKAVESAEGVETSQV